MYAYVSLPRHRASRASLLRRRAELIEPPCIPLPSPCGALAAIARRSRVPRGALPTAAWSYPGRRASLLAAARRSWPPRVAIPVAARRSRPPRGAFPAAVLRSRPPRGAIPAAARSYHGHRAELSLPPWGTHPAAEPRSLAAVRSSPGRHTWPATNPPPPPGPRVTCDVLRHGGWSCACSSVNYG
ncbi:hypothetical protein PVAP13_9NG575614 [Panicum virgatum]|uniref:Uncharacterized protein n=1 Tax=Panicum virgatum TaxID=38727 RepID=A0A8T0N023_PANVG|nr:hypothetical protein PVAP13_9NG575614 [Panicum virgatum]